MQPMSALLDNTPFAGRLVWIGTAAARRQEIESVGNVLLEVGTGLAGDHHAISGKSKRQVTIIQAEHLPVVASILGIAVVKPEQCRRNLAVSGINIAALKGDRFRIGTTLLEGTGFCHPCSRMNETLGPGGCHAMRGHGGITAIVIEGGTISVGDAVTSLGPADSQSQE